MMTNFDSYTLCSSKPFGADTAASDEPAPHWTYSDDVDDDASRFSEMHDACEDEHEMDFPVELGPNFLESGQLMWEIAAHTERTAHDDCHPCMRPTHVPEIVFTDTSEWSADFEEATTSKQEGKDDNNDAVKGMMRLEDDGGDVGGSFEKPKFGLLSGQHCFEIMTDENCPLVSNASPAEDENIESQQKTDLLSTSRIDELEVEERSKEAANEEDDNNADDKDVRAAGIVTTPVGSSICPGHLVVPDQKWRKQPCVGMNSIGGSISSNEINNKKAKKIAVRAIQDCTEESHKVAEGMGSPVPSPMSKHVSGMPIADTAFDIFGTHDPRFVIGDNSSDEELSLQSPVTPSRSPKLSKINVQPLGEDRSVYETWTLHQPRDHAEDSPRVHVPGCSLKEVLSSAMSKFNEVLYNCTHTKQRKKEKEMLKRIRTSGKGTLTPNSSSAYGAYRRRNTIICQKMEGMINNETKSKSTKKSTRSRLPSLAGAHASLQSSFATTSSNAAAKQNMKRKAGNSSCRLLHGCVCDGSGGGGVLGAFDVCSKA